ncbi:MAG: hypothetical protein KME32_36185 [Mojavia pulchra JT2-VF2]|uniref:Uncharacterized protein n=1 Tax=Mojavia pulchra JT2-VF2 TaxID=287848 RepID=A0A951Q7R7_9NOST|nr:hypothetical protein [Mojavia pulchra JT2-VF2]
MNQCLVPLLHNDFSANKEQIHDIRHTVILAAGRHHSAWAGGWEQSDLTRIKNIQLHPQAQQAIAQSWKTMLRYLPSTLSLPPANLSKNVYPIKQKFDLNRFTNDQIEYLQLYLLVVRALRLCDQRSVQLRNI